MNRLASPNFSLIFPVNLSINFYSTDPSQQPLNDALNGPNGHRYAHQLGVRGLNPCLLNPLDALEQDFHGLFVYAFKYIALIEARAVLRPFLVFCNCVKRVNFLISINLTLG